MKPPEAINLDKGAIAYRGEGNVTLVIAIKNIGKVLRFPKYPFDQIICRSNMKAKLLHHIWFAKKILKKLINEAMFDEPELVLVSQEDIELINKLWKQSRPNHRIFKVIPHQESWALLLNDYCCIPSEPALCSYLVGPVISVEIKPKQGFPPLLHHLDDEKPVEARVCRFALKQAFKLKTMPIKEESNYCPLDLFSGCQTRMINAIKNLMKTPQNNFRIFRESELIYSDGNMGDLDVLLTGFSDDKTCNEDQRSEKVLSSLLIEALTLPFRNSCASLVDDLDLLDNKSHHCSYHNSAKCDFPCQGEHKFQRKSVLETILKLQKLDTIGSFRALKMFNHLKRLSPELASLLDNYTDHFGNIDSFFPPSLGTPYKNENETEPEYYFRKIWEYLISMIAKDCSIMVSMQRIVQPFSTEAQPGWFKEMPGKIRLSQSSPPSNGQSHNGFQMDSEKCHVITEDVTKAQYAVSIAIIDLDLKRTSNISEIYKKDLKLIDAFKDHLSDI